MRKQQVIALALAAASTASLVTGCGGKKEEAPAGNGQPAATQAAADTSAQQSAAVANGEVWKCTQTLNTPTGYQGGAIRLELIQEVNGEMTSTQVVDGEKLTFPYTLDITGAPGVGAGTLYVSEQINGTYQQLGQYPITFQKAE